MNLLRITAAIALLATLVAFSSTASADPLPGEILKFYQTPLNNGLAVLPPQGVIPPGSAPAPFPGHDELSTAVKQTDGTYLGQYMADDFADTFNTPIVHIMWWGSYMQNTHGPVPKFLITVENDVPADPNDPASFSHPGTTQLSQIVTLGALAPQSGTFTETAVPLGMGLIANPDGNLWQYNAELAIPIPETKDVVQWLKIVALVDPDAGTPITWGWHNRDYGINDPLASVAPNVFPGEFNAAPAGGNLWHFQDDAVTGPITINLDTAGLGITVIQDAWTPTNYIPSWDGIDYSKDLAFALYTIPEPSTLALLSLGAVALAASRWSRRRRTA